MTSLDVNLAPEERGAAAAAPLAASSPQLRQIVVLVPSDRVRAWAPRLADLLRQQLGLPTRVQRAPWTARTPIPSEALEQRLLGARPPGHADWVDTSAFDPAEGVDWSETLLINATERDHRSFPAALRQSVILSPMFHGVCGAEGLVRPLLSGESPHLGVLLSADGASSLLQGARLAAPERAIMRRALHLVFGRAITLLAGAAAHVLNGRGLPEPAPTPRLQPHAVGLDFWWRFGGAGLSKLSRFAARPLVRHGWWCMGVRRMQSGRGPLELDLRPETFTILESGPDRYYADPFLLRHDGLTALFFEDYDYGCARGAISYVLLDEEGRVGPVSEALVRPYHLSYPFVFVHEGTALMVPESCENGTIELYEAQRFPDRWRLRAVLMEHVDASDTTLHFDPQSGLWWMFSAVAEFGSSSHDTLSIFFSERLEGPWRPHACNPVKLDPGASRPAGPLLSWGGRLFRPAQDCTGGYGEALVWCEIEALTPDVFRERPVAHRRPGRGFDGLHTYGRAAGFEVADFKKNRPRIGGGVPTPRG